MSDPGYVVSLSWAAQKDLERVEYGTGLEVYAGGLGRVRDNGCHVEVDRIIPGVHGPWQDWRAPVDTETMLRYERDWDGTADEVRFVCDLHSHEIEAGPAVPSDVDFDHWRFMSKAPGQTLFAGLIISPSAELWENGYPSGRYDWDEPILRAWVVREGEIWAAGVVLEEQWFAELEAQVKQRPRRSF